MQAMIFAAGLGTRLKPLTDTVPKALVTVGGVSLLEHTVKNLISAGADRIVVNVHHFSQQIKDFLRQKDNFGTDISISDETDMLLDTGGGLKKAAPLFNAEEPILIHNVDILSNVSLKDFYRDNRMYDVTLLVSERKTKRYLLFDYGMRLMGWTNIETGEVRSPYKDIDVTKYRKLAFAGIHLFSPQLFPLMEDFPDKFGIMDFYLSVCHKVNIHGVVKEDLRIMDVGKAETIGEAEDFLKIIES